MSKLIVKNTKKSALPAPRPPIYDLGVEQLMRQPASRGCLTRIEQLVGKKKATSLFVERFEDLSLEELREIPVSNDIKAKIRKRIRAVQAREKTPNAILNHKLLALSHRIFEHAVGSKPSK